METKGRNGNGVLALCLLLSFFLGLTRYLLGHEYALSFFFLVPIYLATKYYGRSAGNLLAVFSVVCWLGADLALIEHFAWYWIPWINESLRLLVFLYVVHILARQQQHEAQLEELAATDDLTGVANRRCFCRIVKAELDRSGRHLRPLGAIYLDVDDFKVINDQFGHEMGDQLLIEMGRVLVARLRAMDVVARIGGDEFAVLLPETDEAAAQGVANKLELALTDAAAGLGLEVRFSLGVVGFTTPPANVDELLRVVDERMYQVKRRHKAELAAAMEGPGA